MTRSPLFRGGLKENVTMGGLIPAGTGFEWYQHVRIRADNPVPTKWRSAQAEAAAGAAQ